jgi:hypothetical protein
VHVTSRAAAASEAASVTGAPVINATASTEKNEKNDKKEKKDKKHKKDASSTGKEKLGSVQILFCIFGASGF